jgi:Ca2+/H+ antiporter, TMEM165/GDT1 family
VLDLVGFAVVFGTIALFEFLDRTNFALLSFAAREPPIPAWIGATSAFAATTLLSVAIGSVLVDALRPELYLVRLAGGILLLGYAGYLLVGHGEEQPSPAGRSTLTTAFLMIFLLELGDTTMILTINFVAAYTDAILVGIAAFLGLAFVAGTACLLGPRLGARVEPKQLELVVIAVLATVGVLTILYAIDPGVFPSWAG